MQPPAPRGAAVPSPRAPARGSPSAPPARSRSKRLLPPDRHRRTVIPRRRQPRVTRPVGPLRLVHHRPPPEIAHRKLHRRIPAHARLGARSHAPARPRDPPRSRRDRRRRAASAQGRNRPRARPRAVARVVCNHRQPRPQTLPAGAFAPRRPHLVVGVFPMWEPAPSSSSERPPSDRPPSPGPRPAPGRVRADGPANDFGKICAVLCMAFSARRRMLAPPPTRAIAAPASARQPQPHPPRTP